MARITHIMKPADLPGNPDAESKAAIEALFEHLFPGYASVPDAEKPDLGGAKSGWAMVAHSPELAMKIGALSSYVVKEMPFTVARKDIRELAVQTLNLHFKCTSSFEAHVPVAESVGIPVKLQAAIPYWQTSTFFTDEQRLVIEYTQSVVTGDVPEALFARVVAAYGERGALEFTVAIANWSFWAMILGATKP